MKHIKLASAILAISTALFSMACNSDEPDPTVLVEPYTKSPSYEQSLEVGDDFYARDNLDLNAVGSLLENSTDAANFEYLLNSDNRINNIDLNGDGYVDYISVVEYEDRDTRQRGFTLFDRFGLNDIQEIASLVFDWDRNNRSGIRTIITGNQQIYGDDYYYETNWNDRNLAIADWAFRDRDTYYQSPYYYNNYPPNYTAYQVLGTNTYINQMREIYPKPIFIKTTQPTIINVRIKSSYKNRSMTKIWAKLAKPSKEQEDYRNNNKGRTAGAPTKEDSEKSDDSRGRDQRSDDKTKPPTGKSEKSEQPDGKSPDEKGGKPDNGKKQKTTPKAGKPAVKEQRVKPNKQAKPNNKTEKQKRGNEAAKPGKRT